MNSLWLGDTICRHGPQSTLVRVMVFCLMAQIWHLNQYWLFMSRVLQHSYKRHSTENFHKSNHYNEYEICTSKIKATILRGQWVSSLRPRKNGRHFADDIFKCIFLNENIWIPIKISMKFVSWMKMLEFWLHFHWSLLLRVQLTIFHHWFR